MFDTSRHTIATKSGQASDYKDIFNQRGKSYHQAMAEFPEARDQEFINIIKMAAPQLGHIVCDVPSGGGYLMRYLPCDDYEVVALETSKAFYQFCTANGKCRAVLTELDNIDLPDASVDCIISLAGLHHLPNRPAFFREAYRILKTGGTCCVADVKADTGPADFLNVFVDRWNSMGHKGDFFDASAPRELESAGFKVVNHYLNNYHWQFQDVEDMCRYVTMLFGLDLADPDEVKKGIESYLGYRISDGTCQMNWGLLFMKGIK